MWEMRWARDLVGGWTVYSVDVGDEVGLRFRTCHIMCVAVVSVLQAEACNTDTTDTHII